MKADEEIYIESFAKKRAIEFEEWCDNSMWSKYQDSGLWYNTYRYEVMEHPITIEQLYELFLKEQNNVDEKKT